MKKKKLIVASILTFCIVAGSTSPVFADSKEKTITKEYTFKSESSNFDYTENQNITIKDVEYEAVNIEYEVLEDGLIEKVVDYPNQINKEIPLNIKEGNETLDLKDVEWTAVPLSKEISKTADTEPKFDSTTRLDFDAVGNLSKVTSKRTDYIIPFSVTGKFYGNSNVEYYIVNESDKYPNNSVTPIYQGYENVLKKHLKLTDDYRITGGKWQGDYVREGENIVRYAEYTGERKTNTYTALYIGEVYNGMAKYTNENSNVYEVKATVTYEKAGFTFIEKIAIGAGVLILILALAVVGIIYFVMKKRNQNLELEELF